MPFRFFTAIAFFSLSILGTSCDRPPEPPAAVRPSDLAAAFRDQPAVAARAYTGRAVLVPTADCRRHGGTLGWSLGAAPDSPPVVVLRFAGEPPTPGRSVWVVGTCAGRVPDGRVREFAGYDFHVLVTGCRVADPPTYDR